MTAVLYPVATSAEAALSAPAGRAAREREARELAGAPVTFVVEPVGPRFASREAALDAFPGRLDDDRPGRSQPAPEDRYCALSEIAADAPAPAPAAPSFTDGRRWPAPAQRPRTALRLVVSYWRVGEPPAPTPADQARAARRRADAAKLTPEELRALARQPLRPVRPQQPLDSGLFEAPAPEAPHILIPDD